MKGFETNNLFLDLWKQVLVRSGLSMWVGDKQCSVGTSYIEMNDRIDYNINGNVTITEKKIVIKLQLLMKVITLQRGLHEYFHTHTDLIFS